MRTSRAQSLETVFPSLWPLLREIFGTAEGLTWLAVAVGVILRVLEYLANRPLYDDEASLLGNLTHRRVLDFHTVLTQYQLAPPAFLVLERLMVRLPAPLIAAARLIPLLCGIASMFLMRAVAERFVCRAAVPIATSLFALTDYLLYYSAEIKQYSSDVMLTLIALLMAAPAPSTARPGPNLAPLALFGLLSTWLSYPAAFVLATIGVYRLAMAAWERRWRDVAVVSIMCSSWALSFGSCYIVSQAIVSKESFLWDWWRFSFLPIPPRSFDDASRVLLALMNLFINPAGLVTALNPVHSGLLAAGFFLLGSIALGKRSPTGLFLVMGPLLFALMASAMHKYPFHGRLLLFLVPSLYLAVAEGIATIGKRTGKLVVVLIVGFFLIRPATDEVWYLAVMRRVRPMDSHGDLRHDLLDYLGERKPTPPSPSQGPRLRTDVNL
jgi:hypothetical protein